MIRNTDITERLYLSKADQTIYIDNCKIPQHHIDGIRFLYRQYKKKKSGVIINDTSGYGRNVQIVLFLKAVRHLFDKPVLVLCHEGTEHDWVEHFQTWTDLCDDVVLETEKPFVKKLVVINTMSNLAAFTRREWSALVMDGDRLAPQVLKLNFKADYKIWVTPVNMRENLEKFSQIYKWLYPKETFDKSQFTPDVKDPLDVVQKAVLLDAFMEDIVAKSEEQDKSRDIENNKKDEDSPPIRISRKNKDATGTKIKRSRRKIIDDEDDAPLSKAKRATTSTSARPNETTVSNEDYEIAISTHYDEANDDFSIDNFKRKSIEEFDEELLGDKEESNIINSEIDLYYEPDQPDEDDSDKLYEMDTLVFGNDTCNDQSANVNDIDKDIGKENDIDHDITPSDSEFDDKDDTQNNTDDDDSKCESEEILDVVLETKHGTEQENDRESPSLFMNEVDNDSDAGSPSVIDEIKSDIDQLSKETQKSESNNKVIEENSNDATRKQTTIPKEVKPDIKNNATTNEVDTKSNENEVVNESNAVTNEVDTSVTKRKTQNSMEDKIREMEEKALKKFKGSILDSLF